MAFAMVGAWRETSAAIEVDVEAQLPDRWKEMCGEVALVVLIDLPIVVGERFLDLVIDGFERFCGRVSEDFEHQGGSLGSGLARGVTLACRSVLFEPLLAHRQECPSGILRARLG